MQLYSAFLKLMLLVALAYPHSAEATISKTAEVPKERFLKYDVPLAGEDLKMEVVPDGDNAEKIESSSVQTQDDTVPWTADPGNANNQQKHTYTIGTVTPGEDWVHIQGTFRRPSGGGGDDTPPKFDVSVHKVVALKPNGTQPEPDGLVVVKNQQITFKVYPEETANFKYPNGVPTWHTRQMKGDGEWTNWAAVPGANGPNYSYTASTSGIFRLKAVFPGGIEVMFLRENDEKINANAYGDGKKGQPDAFGVVDKQLYNSIRLKAREALLSTAWAFDVANNNTQPPFAQNTNKCNQFVGDRVENAGGTVPRLSGEFPMANQWAGTITLTGWSSATATAPYPQPGWVVAFPRKYVSAVGNSGAGHVGILDYDGVGIGAGNEAVSKVFSFHKDKDEWPGSDGSLYDVKDGPTKHRKN